MFLLHIRHRYRSFVVVNDALIAWFSRTNQIFSLKKKKKLIKTVSLIFIKHKSEREVFIDCKFYRNLIYNKWVVNKGFTCLKDCNSNCKINFDKKSRKKEKQKNCQRQMRKQLANRSRTQLLNRTRGFSIHRTFFLDSATMVQTFGEPKYNDYQKTLIVLRSHK